MISAAIGIIFEHLHRNREISEAQLGFGSRLRFLIVGLHAGAGCLNSHFHQWRASQWRVGSNVPHPKAGSSAEYLSRLQVRVPAGTPHALGGFLGCPKYSCGTGRHGMWPRALFWGWVPGSRRVPMQALRCVHPRLAALSCSTRRCRNETEGAQRVLNERPYLQDGQGVSELQMLMCACGCDGLTHTHMVPRELRHWWDLVEQCLLKMLLVLQMASSIPEESIQSFYYSVFFEWI